MLLRGALWGVFQCFVSGSCLLLFAILTAKSLTYNKNTFCTSVHSDARLWCYQMSVSVRSNAVHSLSNDCVWAKMVQGDKSEFSWYDAGLNLTVLPRMGKEFFTEKLTAYSCQLGDTVHKWIAVRIGPFDTYGGNDIRWGGSGPVEVNGRIDQLDPLVQDDAESLMFPALTGFYNSPVWPDGSPYSFPPIRLHHTLTPGYVSDYPCLDEFGAAVCQMMLYPDGFGIVMSSPTYDSSSLVVDTRHPSSNALTWWMQVSSRWAFGRTVRRVHTLTALSPSEGTELHDRSFWVRPNSSSLMWFSVRWPRDGIFVNVHWHTHHIHDHSKYIFSGEPAELGLQRGRFRTAYSAIPLDLPRAQFTIDEATKHVFSAVNEGRERCKADAGRQCKHAKLVCRDVRKGLEFVANKRCAECSVGLYGRTVEMDCYDYEFSHGDAITLVAFTEPVDFAKFTYLHDVFWGRSYDGVSSVGRFFLHHDVFLLYIDKQQAEVSSISSEMTIMGGHKPQHKSFGGYRRGTGFGGYRRGTGNLSLMMPEMDLQLHSDVYRTGFENLIRT